MIRVNRISLRNWRRVREAIVEFPTCGTIAVIGRRSGQASDYLQSSGAGKTQLGEAVSHALFGIPGDAGDELSYLGRGNSYVKVECEISGRPLVVEWGYKCRELGGAGEMLKYTLGDEVICRGHLDGTRAELTAALGIPPLIAGWSIFLDGEQLKFNRLSQAQQVDLLMQALRQPSWPAYHKLALKYAEDANERESVANGSLQSSRETVADQQEELARAKIAVTEAEKDLEETTRAFSKVSLDHGGRLKVAEERWKTLSAAQKIAHLELTSITRTAQASAREEYATTLIQANTDLAGARATTRKNQGLLNEWRAHVSGLRTQILNFGNRTDKCPTCSQQWPDAEHRRTELDKLTKSIDLGKEKLSASQDQVNEAEIAEQEAEDGINAILEKIATRTAKLTEAASTRYEKSAQAAEDSREEFNHLRENQPVKPDERPLTEARTRHQTTLLSLERATAKIELAAIRLAEAEKDRAIAKYWTEALGPNGIPNQILESSLEPLNQAAQVASHALSGGEISVSFSASRELASGQQRSKLTVNVSNPLGAHKLSGFSKGETGLTNLIISESLTMIGQLTQRCSWRWLDEPINNQDRRHVYNYFKRQAIQHNLAIFIVDHHPDARELADHVLIAEKDSNGFTTYVWE